MSKKHAFNCLKDVYYVHLLNNNTFLLKFGLEYLLKKRWQIWHILFIILIEVKLKDLPTLTKDEVTRKHGQSLQFPSIPSTSSLRCTTYLQPSIYNHSLNGLSKVLWYRASYFWLK